MKVKKLFFTLLLAIVLFVGTITIPANASAEFDLSDQYGIKEQIMIDNFNTDVYKPDDYSLNESYSAVVLLSGENWGQTDTERLALYANYFAARGSVVFHSNIYSDKILDQASLYASYLNKLADKFLEYKVDFEKIAIVAEETAVNSVLLAFRFEDVQIKAKALISLRGVVDTNPSSGYINSETFLGKDAYKINIQNYINDRLPKTLMFASETEKLDVHMPDTSEAEIIAKYNVNQYKSQQRFCLDMNRYGVECKLIGYREHGKDFYYNSQNTDPIYDILFKTDAFLKEQGIQNVTNISVPDYEKQSVREVGMNAYAEIVVESQEKSIPQVYNVKDYGVTGDGVTSDSTKIAEVIETALKNGGGEIYFPKGVYYIDKLIKVTAEDIRLKIRGDGVGITVFRQENLDGTFYFESTGEESRMEFCDFMVITYTLENCGTALEFNLLEDNNAKHSTLSVKNIEIKGGAVTQPIFNYGYRFRNQYKPEFYNLVFAGPFGPDTFDLDVRESVLYKTQIAVDVSGSVSPEFRFCYMWSAYMGYYMENIAQDGSNGFYLYNSYAVQTRTGISITGAERVTGVVDSGHYNNRDYGIYVEYAEDIVLRNLLMYNEDMEEWASEYNDIYLNDVHNAIITDIVFHFIGTEKRINVYVKENSENVIVSRNFFNAKGNGIFIENPQSNVYVFDNMFTSSNTGYEIEGSPAFEDGNIIY